MHELYVLCFLNVFERVFFSVLHLHDGLEMKEELMVFLISLYEALIQRTNEIYRVHLVIYTRLIKRCRVQSINYEHCDPMEFWEDTTDKLATQFHILISKIFLFLRRFWSRFVYTVLVLSPRCLKIEVSFPTSQKTIGRIVHRICFHTTTFVQLGVSVSCEACQSLHAQSFISNNQWINQNTLFMEGKTKYWLAITPLWCLRR